MAQSCSIWAYREWMVLPCSSGGARGIAAATTELAPLVDSLIATLSRTHRAFDQSHSLDDFMALPGANGAGTSGENRVVTLRSNVLKKRRDFN
jgi:hypothetical protein